jgi:AcrR family transcriptional regulator
MKQELTLRARKKARTREVLVDIAARLFAERSFEAVTVADIARAAEVSEPTVYNYFPTKEALVLDEDDAFADQFAAMVRDRPEDVTAAAAVCSQALAFLDSMILRPPSKYRRGGMPFLVVNSPAVRKAWLIACDRYAEAMAVELAVAQPGMSRVAASLMASALLAPFRLIVDAVGLAISEEADVAARMHDLRPEIEDSMQWLSGALAQTKGGAPL